MRKSLLLILLLFLPFLIFSQKTPVKKTDSASAESFYLGASGGLSLPLGAYSNGNVKNASSGFANPGYLAQINVDWIGKDNYGIALQYTFQTNPLKSSVKNDTLSGMGQPIGTGSWRNHYLMAGLGVIKFIHKVYLEGRVLVGFVLSSSSIFNTIDPVYKTPSTNKGIGLAYGIQLGAGYKVSPRVTVKASLEYLIGNPKIHHQYGAQPIGVDTITGATIYSAPLNMETKRTVSALLVKAGVVFKLSK